MKIRNYILFWEKGIEMKLFSFRFILSKRKCERKMIVFSHIEFYKDRQNRINFIFFLPLPLLLPAGAMLPSFILISYLHYKYETPEEGNFLNINFLDLLKKQWKWKVYYPWEQKEVMV